MSEDRSEPQAPTPGQTLGAMWLYTVLRFGLFLALWGLLWVARVPGLLAATIALVLSIPLSYILLRKQRARLAANLEARVMARQAHRHTLDSQLAGETEQDGQDGPAVADAAEPRAARPSAARPKRRPGRSAQQ
ncbi:MAG TPA: DUF4229 domain-containing protein [Jatrophihabitans sp.]|jgi:hypothetical protein|nr:DUF4229 domain-containing protein [Jatrophihabitans sp.]